MQLAAHIPTNFKSARGVYVANVLQAAFKKQLSSDQLREILDEADLVTKFAVGPPDVHPLWEASLMYGTPFLSFLCPPVSTCIYCASSLKSHNEAVRVLVYTKDGPLIGLKTTLRCTQCAINYRYAQFGSDNDGYKFYSEERPLVEASRMTYIERSLYQAWVSSRYVTS